MTTELYCTVARYCDGPMLWAYSRTTYAFSWKLPFYNYTFSFQVIQANESNIHHNILLA